MQQVGQVGKVRRFVVGAILTTLAGASLMSACGGDDDLQRVEVPELTIEGVDNGQIDLRMPPRDDRAESQQEVKLRNSGKATLKVTRLELVNTPDRLQAYSRTEDFCSTDSECGDGQACLVTTCVDLGMPSTPVEISPGLLQQLDFLITKGSSELDCPDAPASVAPEFADDYCGELVIETNAINNSGIVEEGKASIIFLRPNASGQLVVTPNPITFDNLQPGSTDSVDFSLQNTGSQVLTVDSVSVSALANFFTISPMNFPTEIQPSTSSTWTLTVDIPVGTEESEYVGADVDLLIDSSASSGGDSIPVILSNQAPSAPNIELSAVNLKFDQQTSQVITISNTGDATLVVNRLKIDPIDARDFYSFSIDGQDVTSTFTGKNVAKGDSFDLTVTFDGSASENSPVGILTIGHNVESQEFSSEVVLLGDEGDVPIARVYPEGFTFLAEDGNTASRTFVVRNIGTAALDVTASMMQFTTGVDSEFNVTGVPMNIQPGGIASGTVTFTGANATADVGNVVFTTNDTVGSLLLGVKDVTSAAAAVLPVVTPLFQNDARVGAELGFTASSSSPADAASGAIWTLIERPAGSSAFFFRTGEELHFTPDVTGNYKIGLTMTKDQREGQTVYDLTVVE